MFIIRTLMLTLDIPIIVTVILGGDLDTEQSLEEDSS